LRLGLADCPIRFSAEIVPKQFLARLPFLLQPLTQYFLSPAAPNLRGRSVIIKQRRWLTNVLAVERALRPEI